jgi:hypothetical protein
MGNFGGILAVFSPDKVCKVVEKCGGREEGKMGY